MSGMVVRDVNGKRHVPAAAVWNVRGSKERQGLQAAEQRVSTTTTTTQRGQEVHQLRCGVSAGSALMRCISVVAKQNLCCVSARKR